MTNRDLSNIQFPQQSIKVAVEFYDDAERDKLLLYPTAQKMEKLIEEGVEVSISEFLTYYLFHKKRPGKDGWRDFNEIGQRIGSALAELHDWLNFTGTSIAIPDDLNTQDKAITERLGESIALSVIGKIHGLTEADWDRIPARPGPTGTKTFDYQIASDGKHIVQLEAKGSSVINNSKKTSSISNHKTNIEKKKKFISEQENTSSYPYSADLRYGAITVIGENTAVPVRCLLVDPPTDGDGTDARRLRVLQRMKYLRDWISFISPRSQLASALQTRLAALERLPDPFLLDGVPLLKGNGKPFDLSPFFGFQSKHTSFFATKSIIKDGPAGGITILLPSGELFFLGIRESLLNHAASQKFSQLVELKSESGSMIKTVECSFTERDFDRLDLPPRLRERASKTGEYFVLELSGQIHYSDSGILFGVLPITKLELQK